MNYTDAEMIDWVTAKQAVVAPHYGRNGGDRAWVLFAIEETPPGYGQVKSIEEYGSTWRAVVEKAMKRMP